MGKSILAALTLAMLTFSATVLMAADGLVGWWPLDGDTTDASGNGNDGTPVGDPTWADGQPGAGKALSFDGVDDHVLLNAGAALSGPTDFTLLVWIKMTSINGHSLLQQRNGGYNGEYMLNVGAMHDGTFMNSGQVYFMVYNGAFQWEIWSSKTVNDGAWHHVAAVRDGETGTIYIDGEPDGGAEGPIKDLDPALKVAMGADIRANALYFDGEMDDVLIYGSALSLEEVKGISVLAVEPAAKLATVWGAIKQ